MTSIGWAGLQIIPTINGVAGQISSQLVTPLQQGGQQAGQAAGQGVASGLTSQRTTVEKASAQLAAARGKEADAAGKVRVAELKLQELRDKGTASASQIAAAEERLATANRGHDNAMAGRVRAVNNLTEARARAANGADDEADSVDDATDAHERNGDSAVDLAKKLGGLAIAAAGIGSAMDLATQSMEKSQLGSKLAASFGETPEEAKRYGEVAGNLYADGIGASMDDVAASVAAVGGTFGSLDSMGGARLEELSAKASNFAAVFDQDVAGSVQTAGMLMQNGLADNADQAFDMMTKGMQEVSVSMRDELPEILQEYGTNFRALGFNGADSFNLLIDAASKGKFALDKTGDALKEFTIRGSDMSASSTEAFKSIGLDAELMASDIAVGGENAQYALQKTADALLGIEDPSTRANTAIALFGSPLEDMSVDQIPLFLESLSGADDVMGDFTGATDQMSETLNDNAGSAFENMKRAITGELLDGLESMADWVGRNSELLKTIGTVIAPLVIGLVAYKAATLGMAAATTAWNAIQMVLNGTMMMNPIGLIVAAIAGLVAAVILIATKTTWFQTIWDVVWGGVTAAWDWAYGKLSAGFELLKGAFSAVGDKVGEVKDWVVRKWDEMVGFVTGLPGRISSAVSGMWDGVKDAFKGALNWIIDKWNNFRIPAIRVAGVQVSPEINFPDIARFAAGGGVFGGTPGKDSVLAMLMPDEHVWTTQEVAAVGGHDEMIRMRGAALAGDLPKYAGGGAVSGPGIGDRDKPKPKSDFYNNAYPHTPPPTPAPVVTTGNPGRVYGPPSGVEAAPTNYAAPSVSSNPAAPAAPAAPVTPTAPVAPSGGGGIGEPYGLPTGSSVSYGSAGFPEWVTSLAGTYGLQASTYSGHQESDRGEAGYAPNPGHLNRGIDWSGPVASMQTYAEWLLSIAPNNDGLEQIIWQNPNTGQKIGWAGRSQDVSGSYFAADYSGHQDHVHTRTSASIGEPAPEPAPASPDTATSTSGVAGTTSTTTESTSSPEKQKVFSARDRIKTMFTDVAGIWADSAIEIFGVGEWLDLADRYTITPGTSSSTTSQSETMSNAEADAAILAGTKDPVDTTVRTGHDLYAYEIARAAKELGLGEHAAAIGEATALVEVGDPLKMFANSGLPASLLLPHDAVGSNGSSTGLFQQQDFPEWGTIEQRMNPFESAKMFYEKFPLGWELMDPGTVAQAVQRSAFPAKYGQAMGRGQELVDNTGLFDEGGWLMPGTFSYNGLNEPEPVLKGAHWKIAEANIDKIDELVGAGVGGGPRVQITNNNHQIIADQASWQRDQASRERTAIMRFGVN
ncbi:MAG: hypothetical protein U5O16_03030 [Rhodococcus sp. (in: high G+C Gram-positive bacteria)]|uniref:hypothetical protein n=1 Tax=Rhodococcus sp. TaxID=1831 RepID=UPI002ADCD5F7|nr:hypothetical protein [Rhodococcus sp. (in: high G+C Gram-positive bacteria)]